MTARLLPGPLCPVGGLASLGQAAIVLSTVSSIALGNSQMHSLHIALHDGFRGHHVVIAVDGRTVFDRAEVTTDLRISRADSVDVEVQTEQINLTVTVNPGGISGSTDHNVTTWPYLAIDLQSDGTLRWTRSHEPFQYL
jgi:hypothetical protein